jgi:hypothetical protein
LRHRIEGAACGAKIEHRAIWIIQPLGLCERDSGRQNYGCREYHGDNFHDDLPVSIPEVAGPLILPMPQ